MTRKLVLIVAAAGVLVAAFVLKQRDRNDGSEEPTRIEASAQSREPLPRLVDLGADQCVPCKKMAPILRELAEEYRGRLIVEFIDVWKNPEAAEPYGIRMIPTQIFYDASGVERFRHEGFLAKEAILAKWRDLGVPLGPPPTTGAM